MRQRCLVTLGLTMAAGLTGCVPMVKDELPNGDHVITTYLRMQGMAEARDDNLWVARRECHGGVVLVDETHGKDANGTWDRLVYGCAEQAEGSSTR